MEAFRFVYNVVSKVQNEVAQQKSGAGRTWRFAPIHPTPVVLNSSSRQLVSGPQTPLEKVAKDLRDRGWPRNYNYECTRFLYFTFGLDENLSAQTGFTPFGDLGFSVVEASHFKTFSLSNSGTFVTDSTSNVALHELLHLFGALTGKAPERLPDSNHSKDLGDVLSDITPTGVTRLDPGIPAYFNVNIPGVIDVGRTPFLRPPSQIDAAIDATLSGLDVAMLGQIKTGAYPTTREVWAQIWSSGAVITDGQSSHLLRGREFKTWNDTAQDAPWSPFQSLPSATSNQPQLP